MHVTRILLVDDHQTFLAGTAMILEKHGYQVTTAARGTEALKLVEKSDFDLYLFDLKLPEMNGYQLTEAVLRLKPEAVIVILTGEEAAEHYDGLMELGVTGILEKSMAEPEFAASLRLALQQLVVLPLPLARQLRTRAARSGSANSDESQTAVDKPLTDKEKSVLRLIAQGHKNKDIADRLFMSQRNVEYVISHLFGKLSVSSRQEAVLKGIELGFLKLDR
jgi:two-component system, NarL family, competent response regulator ComA